MSVRIIVDDCLVAMKAMLQASVDLIVTSPPYNIGLGYRTYNDTLAYDDYLSWIGQFFSEAKRVLKEDGSLFLNIGSTSVNPWLAFDVATQARDVFTLQNHIIWAKSVSIGNQTHGHFKPLNSDRFLNNTYEDLFHFTKSGTAVLDRKAVGVPYMDKANITRFSTGGDLRCRGNVWHVPYKTIRSKAEKGNHPATYPVELAAMCIKLAGLAPGSVVLDPFAGTGSTLVAAKDLGHVAIGIELDAEYARIATERTR